MVQRWAVHRSASEALSSKPLSVRPTAVQVLAVGHDTPRRMVPDAGVLCLVQRWPFQRSANVTVTKGGRRPWSSYPTAVHAVGEEHETFCSEARAWAGLGVPWIDQRRPFHCSASVLLPENPTAVHAVGAGQETP